MRIYQTGPERLNYLVEKYITNSFSRAEMEELFQLVDEGHEEELYAALERQWQLAREKGVAAETNWDLLFQKMMLQSREMDGLVAPSPRRKRPLVRRRWSVAAIFFLFLCAGGAAFRIFRVSPAPAIRSIPFASRYKNDVQPGGNKAILTLSDGSSIVLDSAHNGTLSVQGSAKVLKSANGQLVYESVNHKGGDRSLVFNTISTPRGGQYQIGLPDGSKVWLNATSSLRFPTAFTGKERRVELSGEAYFEVAPNSHQPFSVAVFAGEPGKGQALQQVEVLGTEFNVMAYTDENIVKTTLLTGAVQIAGPTGARTAQLKPGEQAQLVRDDVQGIHVVEDADTEAAIAWKNGYFNFGKADIQTIMRQLSRWYDVDVSFRGNGNKDRIFWGGIQRNLRLSAVLGILERSGVEFTIDGRKVVVNL